MAYSQSGQLSEMERTLKRLPFRDGVPWNLLISGYSLSTLVGEAVKAYNTMMRDKGYSEDNAETFFHQRTSCGMIKAAHQLFQGMEKDSASWTAMIQGLAQSGLAKEAIELYREMKTEGFTMDQYAFGSVLPGCGGLGAINQGKQIHASVTRISLQDHIYVGSALIDMHCKCKCKCIDYAKTVLDRMKQQNCVLDSNDSA